MKKIGYFILMAIALTTQPALADDGAVSSVDLMNYVGIGAILTTLVIIVAAMLIILHALKVITKVLIGEEAYAKQIAEEKAAKIKPVKPKVNLVEKLLSLKPLSEEKSLLMEHEYDGIQELDNPVPSWFMGLFYSTIAFAVCYLLIYHVFGIGQLQYEEYRTEVAVANKEKAAYLAKAANKVDENTVKLTTDPAVLASGRAIFKERCAPCHGDKAQGVVGPNLTDDYWLHGGKINEVFKTIKYGVSGKGMPTWESQLTPKQLSDVANFVKSLHGTNPPNPKDPQGEKETDDAPAPKTAITISQTKI